MLKSFGISGKVVPAIEKIYNNSKHWVRKKDGYSDWFEVLTGIRQGCYLSPLLFSLANDWVMKQAAQGKGMKWTDKKNFSDLDFAKDTAALARSMQDLQLLVDDISNYAGNTGLVIGA